MAIHVLLLLSQLLRWCEIMQFFATDMLVRCNPMFMAQLAGTAEGVGSFYSRSPGGFLSGDAQGRLTWYVIRGSPDASHVLAYIFCLALTSPLLARHYVDGCTLDWRFAV